jgi:hypothetical protein
MEDTSMDQKLFAIMRFQILTTALSSELGERLTDAYVYAWDARVYPLFNHGPDWHGPFADCFEVSKAMLDELSKYLDEAWRDGKVPSFYQLEERYRIREGGGEWDRGKLIHACRYMRLQGLFDDAFWKRILEPTNHPTEASMITDKFSRSDDLYLT